MVMFVFSPIFPVPKFTINKNCQFDFLERQVGFSENSSIVFSISVSTSKKCLCKSGFNF